MKQLGRQPSLDLPFECMEWARSSRVLLSDSSVPIQDWTVPQLRFRLSFEEEFWPRFALYKELLCRGFTVEDVAMFESQSTWEVVASLPPYKRRGQFFPSSATTASMCRHSNNNVTTYWTDWH
jgi:hypothetical protein